MIEKVIKFSLRFLGFKDSVKDSLPHIEFDKFVEVSRSEP